MRWERVARPMLGSAHEVAVHVLVRNKEAEIRDSLALSCHQLVSSICPEEAYLAGTASGHCPEAATASSCPPVSEGALTLDRREEVCSLS